MQGEFTGRGVTAERQKAEYQTERTKGWGKKKAVVGFGGKGKKG